jgi:hypothetical protein
MALKANHSNLPIGNLSEGWKPDAVPRFGMLLVDAWARRWIPEDELAHAVDGTRLRFSWAGKCARDLSYWLQGFAPSDPMDIADHWRTGLGRMVHELLQAEMKEAYGESASVEHIVDMREIGIDGSGHVDVYLVGIEPTMENAKPDLPTRKIVIEVKTINGFGFKMAVGARGAPEGPRSNAVRQVSMAAEILDADECVIIYLSLECLSKREWDKIGGGTAHRKFMAEWTFGRDVYKPIAQAELQRLNRVLELTDEHLADPSRPLPPRSIPDLPHGARITDPARGTWQLIDRSTDAVKDAGTTWMCDYCANRTRCIEDGAS